VLKRTQTQFQKLLERAASPYQSIQGAARVPKAIKPLTWFKIHTQFTKNTKKKRRREENGEAMPV
jgi:hypothetical protein